MKTWLTLDAAREFLRTGTGRGVKVAILDSGVDTSHPALAGLTLADEIAVVDDGVQLRTVHDRARDVFGHGTAIAAIVRSLAPDATLGSFRVLGEQLRSRTAIIQEGVRQALDRGYQIINCSFGCGREDQVLFYKDWIDEAYLRGCHIVAACNNYDHLKREWPGHFPTVITVNFARNAGPESLFFRPGSLVEFSARGEEIEVPWMGGGYKKVTGSSFAAPHVAGLLARLLSRCPGLPPLEAKALLLQLAEPAS